MTVVWASAISTSQGGRRPCRHHAPAPAAASSQRLPPLDQAVAEGELHPEGAQQPHHRPVGLVDQVDEGDDAGAGGGRAERVQQQAPDVEYLATVDNGNRPPGGGGLVGTPDIL